MPGTWTTRPGVQQMKRTNLTEDDTGKKVVNHNGDEIGMISGYEGGRAYVDPDPGLAESIMSKLGWSDVDDEDTYPLDETSVETVTDDEVRIRRDF